MRVDDRARELVYKYGWNTTCFQVLNPEIEKWYGDNSVVGYVQRGRIRIAAGAPVTNETALGDTMRTWEESDSSPVCYFAAESRLTQAASGYSRVVMGAQPMWHPKSWLENLQGSSSLRAQINRAQNKGVTAREWPAERVRNNPELLRIREEWLKRRGLPPMHFLNESDVLGRPEGRRVFVVEKGETPVGLVVLAPIPARQGWLTELFVRGDGAPNGAIELGLQTAVRSVADEGAQLVTMGMVPLARHGSESGSVNPAWFNLLANWARVHGRRFYNFEGLDFFKSKFAPDYWEPIYAVSNEEKFSFSTFLAVVGAFTQVHPAVALASGVRKAAQQELRWVLRGRASKK